MVDEWCVNVHHTNTCWVQSVHAAYVAKRNKAWHSKKPSTEHENIAQNKINITCQSEMILIWYDMIWGKKMTSHCDLAKFYTVHVHNVSTKHTLFIHTTECSFKQKPYVKLGTKYRHTLTYIQYIITLHNMTWHDMILHYIANIHASRQTGKQTDTYTHTHISYHIHTYLPTYMYTYTPTDRLTDRQTGRQAGRQADRQTDRQALTLLLQTCMHACMHARKHTHIHTHIHADGQADKETIRHTPRHVQIMYTYIYIYTYFT